MCDNTEEENHRRVGGQYYIKPWNSRRRVVDANNGSDAVLRGQRVQLWDSSLYKTNQQWSLERTQLTLSTPQIGQEKSKWCWAASALMVGKTYNPNSTKTQSDIARYVLGDAYNIDADRDQVRSACNYANGTVNAFTVINGSISKEYLLQKIKNGNPVIITRYFYKTQYGTDREYGHAFVVFGYQYAGQNDIKFIVRDPLPVNKGATQIWAYEDLVNGWNSGKDRGKWGYCVYKS